ncbi:MAG: 50S ribosomal protein L23 [Bacteroidota bacterium]
MSVLIRPLVTEKVSSLNEKGKYGFIVDVRANKLQIRDAVNKMYGVTVESVNTIRMMGKRKTRYTKAGVVEGAKPNFKKAIVTLKAGEVIDFYSNV